MLSFRMQKALADNHNVGPLEEDNWKMKVRRSILLKAFVELDVVLANVGSLYTFRETSLGLTHVSVTLVRRSTRQVSEG